MVRPLHSCLGPDLPAFCYRSYPPFLPFVPPTPTQSRHGYRGSGRIGNTTEKSTMPGWGDASNQVEQHVPFPSIPSESLVAKPHWLQELSAPHSNSRAALQEVHTQPGALLVGITFACFDNRSCRVPALQTDLPNYSCHTLVLAQACRGTSHEEQRKSRTAHMPVSGPVASTLSLQVAKTSGATSQGRSPSNGPARDLKLRPGGWPKA